MMVSEPVMKLLSKGGNSRGLRSKVIVDCIAEGLIKGQMRESRKASRKKSPGRTGMTGRPYSERATTALSKWVTAEP